MKLGLALLALGQLVSSFEFGAQSRQRACSTMRAGYSQEPEAVPPPFHFLIYNSRNVRTNEYHLNERLTIVLQATGDQRIRQFMIQGRKAYPTRSTDDNPIGFFSQSAGTNAICSGFTGNVLVDDDVATGETREPWKNLTLYWSPPSQTMGHIEFRVTLYTNYNEYWVGEASELVLERGRPLPTTPEPKVDTDIASVVGGKIDTEGCGSTKGCYRNPKGCVEEYCDLIATWEIHGEDNDRVNFELGGDTEGWVALGFSHDKKMGNDEVIECVWNEDMGKVEIRESTNYEDKVNEVNVQQMALTGHILMGAKVNHRIRCRFTRRIELSDRIFDLNDDHYFLVAKGHVDKRGVKKRHVLDTHKDPLVSPSKMNVRDYEDIHGRARYPLVKAHGCLMLLAWMVSTSIAIILARYYKLMWPNDRICRQKVWFACHRMLNVCSMLLTIIAFILIFIHAGGYSKMPDLPAKAHPILGIITTILCILNPLIALCRCSEDHEYRPCFNWLHWLFGTVAYVLSSPALFIGLSLPKAHVPWWATWILLAFMLFHLLCELLLEIHGCINGRKQNQRDMEYELMKKSDPRMELNKYRPDPVGTRFKTIIISMYLVVVIILGLVLIITVAVS